MKEKIAGLIDLFLFVLCSICSPGKIRFPGDRGESGIDKMYFFTRFLRSKREGRLNIASVIKRSHPIFESRDRLKKTRGSSTARTLPY